MILLRHIVIGFLLSSFLPSTFLLASLLSSFRSSSLQIYICTALEQVFSAPESANLLFLTPEGGYCQFADRLCDRIEAVS